MPYLLHHLVSQQAHQNPDNIALGWKQEQLSYAELEAQIARAARGLQSLGLARHERVAVYLPKQFETLISFFAATRAGGCFVPINPVLKPQQVEHILNDCNVRVLVTNKARAQQLGDNLERTHDLRQLVLVDGESLDTGPESLAVHPWSALISQPSLEHPGFAQTDADLAAILYTSGSTGKPKGVVLSHRNLVVGAQSVAEYLGNHAEDRILSVLPLSFDAGLSQITTAFNVGASCYLLDYLLPNDVLKAVEKHQITGLTAVPPLWTQLANLKWTPENAGSLRYFANTGGHMPQALLQQLRTHFFNARPYPMYGLTEAFRSTYLPPEDVDRKPGSIGKAIPNAEILVLREDGTPCQVNEPGELVHRGPLVAQGYWNDPERTALRFKPYPHPESGFPGTELAVWSGDTVRMDEEGYLYFVGRQDEMIKTSGYRVSPSEVEEVLFSSGEVKDAVALGLPHPTLGQGILVMVTALQPTADKIALSESLLGLCRRELPNFMVPQQCLVRDELPRNPNGKIDRKSLVQHHQSLFSSQND